MFAENKYDNKKWKNCANLFSGNEYVGSYKTKAGKRLKKYD